MSSVLPMPFLVRQDLRQRARQITSVLARHGLGWMSMQFGLGGHAPAGPRPRGLATGDGARRKQAEHFRLALEELGGAFIKLGQAISARSDVIPQEYAEELSKLQDAAPPVPLADILKVVQDELHQSPADLFASFESEPLASASIGQVHAGRLRNGDEVVIKIQRPGVAEQIEQDLTILTAMAEWAQAHTTFGREYRVASLVDEFAHTIRGEVDYRAEGRNADRFRANFIDEPALTVPRVYWQYTTERVLTMERVGGIKISDTAALEQAGINRRLVAENSVRMMLREVFEFGFFHADAHPGNFFVRPDAGIALVDYGMVGHLSPRLQTILLDLALSLVRHDPERMTDSLYALGIATETAGRPALQRAIGHLLSRYITSSVKDLAAADMINDLMGVAFRHRLQLPSEVVMFLRVLVMSEGLGIMLDPGFQLFAYAAPFLQRVWNRQRSPQQLAGRLAMDTLDSAEIAVQLPRQVARLLNQLERGTLQVNISPESTRDILQQMQHMANRMALSVILAATIMGLGLVMVAYKPAGWEQFGGWIVLFAFLGSIAFGLYLMWSILRTGGD